MDFSTLTRDASKVFPMIEDVLDKGMYIARGDVDIYFPKRYLDGKLGSLDSRFNTMAMFAIVSGNNYMVHLVPSIMPLTPSATTIVKIDEEDYYKLSWQAGEVICPNTNLVQRSSLAFEIYDNIIAKGKVPPYFDARDYNEVLIHISDFCGVNLNADPAILSGYGASTARNPNDMTKPIRESYKTQGDMNKVEFVRIPLRSVAYGADNTMARLGGSYMNTGLMSSLVNRSEAPQPIEQILIS